MRARATLACFLFLAGCAGSAFDSDESGLDDGGSGEGSGGDGPDAGSGGSSRGGDTAESGGARSGGGGGGRSNTGGSASGGRASGGRPNAGGVVSSGDGGSPAAGGVVSSGDGGSPAAGGVVSSGDGGSPPVGGTTSTGGQAAGCKTAEECPASSTPCRARSCDGGVCGLVDVPAPADARGNCKKLVCDHNGELSSVADDADSDDANPCTVDVCQGGIVSHTPAIGTICNNGKGVCGQNGTCVECTLDAQCGQSTECAQYVCSSGTCKTVFTQAGALCNLDNQDADQCDGQGSCIECYNSGGCGECCVCLQGQCIAA